VQGSEFVGYASPAATVEDAEAFVADVEERHPDATHNVPCYRVRVESGVPETATSCGSTSPTTASPPAPPESQR